MNSQCEGCLCLENGTGGENQLSHMYPDGCLWTSEDRYLYEDNEDNENNQYETNTLSEKEEEKLKTQAQENRAKTNFEHLRDSNLKICIICNTRMKSIDDFCCKDCITKEDRERAIRYQSFQFNQYKNM